jgi:DNA-binding response OmpR family regulator
MLASCERWLGLMLAEKLQNLRVLVVEDHAPLCIALAELFVTHGVRADFAHSAQQGLALALTDTPDVMVLDIGLPGKDGIWLCEQLRKQANHHIPILMLTARDSIADKLRGFEAGADDYLSKPFANAELLARCAALCARHRTGTAHVITIGSLQIDRRQQKATRFGTPLALHARALQILETLAEAYPNAVTRSQLINKLWQDETPPSDPLRSHLYLLRSALQNAAIAAGIEAPQDIIKTLHQVGYKLLDDSPA